MSQGEGEVLRVYVSICLNGISLNKIVFDSCVKSLEYFHMDNISLESTVHWLYECIVTFKVDRGVYEKCAKM